jgi:hypothetical protein
MRRRRLGLATLTGFILATVFSATYAVYERTFQPGPILGAIGRLAFPGIVVGMLATGNAHVGGSLRFVLSVATVFNTLVYGALSYVCLALCGIGKDRDGVA